MATTTALPATGTPKAAPTAAPVRNLAAACVAHALHDGYTDALYAFLPVWRAQFGLSYAALALVRALYSGVMGALQVPADRAARTWSPRAALVTSTLVAAVGLLVAASPLGFGGLCVGLAIAGAGSSLQHPRASVLVTKSFGKDARRSLGVYNFSGDLGKAALPALAAALLPVLAWRWVLLALVGLGLLSAAAVAALAPRVADAPTTAAKTPPDQSRGGFGLLTVIGALDTAARMGFLLFLPFLVQARGGGSPVVGVALALLFVGGAFGKATCAWLAERLGVVGSVVATEVATALLIAATLLAPLGPLLVLLPLLGVVLNGTSSVLYAAVSELSRGDLGRAFAVFYTSVIGSGGVAPILFGLLADRAGKTTGVLAASTAAALVVPLVVALRPYLSGDAWARADHRVGHPEAKEERA